MAIQTTKTFSPSSLFNAANSAVPTNQNKVKAQFWLNIGYLTDVKDDQGEDRFVSLASGIALDTMDTLPTNSKNSVFAQFQAARNDLRDQLVEAAKQLAPGQSSIIGDIGGLQLQIRRVGEEVEVPTDASNVFARKLIFGGVPETEQQAA